ncbi:MAG: hypothetical protein IJQ04_05030 [Prevotella sp.]|nr:hypothetical protein [Prevotella sp.]
MFMEEKDKNVIDGERLGSVSEPIAEASFVEAHERTSEYEMLEKRALKTLAGRAMIEFQEGKCIPSDLAMLHFASLEARCAE